MKLSEALNKAGVSAIVYGESGIGKTHFCGTLPGRTLIIAAEANGIKTLARSAHADDIEVRYLPEAAERIEETADRFNKFFDGLMLEELSYDNVVLDSATELANLLLIQKTDPAKNGGAPTMKNYGEVQFAMKRYLRILRDLAEVKGKNVIVIALEAELVLSQSADVATSKTHPSLSGKKLSPEAEGLYDIVAHMEKKSDGTRYFRLDGSEQFVAKDRFGRKACWATGESLLHPAPPKGANNDKSANTDKSEK